MVYDPKIRSEDLDAYNAGRLHEIRPEILSDVRELAERLKAASAKDAREVLSKGDEEHEE